MKKIIGLLGILLITITIFGQKGGAIICRFGNKSIIIGEEFKLFQHNKMYIETIIYSFRENGHLYVMSYDTIESIDDMFLYGSHDIRKRSVLIYRLDDDGWHSASDIIKTDFWKVSNGIQSYNYHYPKRKDLSDLIDGIGNSYIKKLDDGVIEFNLLNFYGSENDEVNWKYYWEVILLIPNDNKTYNVLKPKKLNIVND